MWPGDSPSSEFKTLCFSRCPLAIGFRALGFQVQGYDSSGFGIGVRVNGMTWGLAMVLVAGV